MSLRREALLLKVPAQADKVPTVVVSGGPLTSLLAGVQQTDNTMHPKGGRL